MPLLRATLQATKAAKDQALKSFRAITNATQADATRLLKNNNYRVEHAVEDFYLDPIAMANATKAGGGTAADKKKLKETQDKLGVLFDEYKGESHQFERARSDARWLKCPAPLTWKTRTRAIWR